MADKTAIEWADTTWNPLLGCERVSPGCDRCYAINTATIRAGNPHPKVAAAFAGLTERRDGRLDWTGRINLLSDRLAEPLGWKKPRKVFVNSQSDLFHKDVPDEFIAEVFAVMALTPHHIYQLLTKRHARMRSLLSAPDFQGYVSGAAVRMAQAQAGRWHPGNAGLWPLPNLWLGVSVENQQWADIRIPVLLDTPAAVRWLSMEPLLGPVRLSAAWIDMPADARPVTARDLLGIGLPNRLDWIVVGGESGPGARPMHPDWVRDLRDRCQEAGVAFFFKQWGGRTPKANGRELDGRTWDEYPQPVGARS